MSMVVNATGWDDGIPSMTTSSTAFSWTPLCASYYQTVEVEGVGEVRTCLFGGTNPKLGVTYGDNGLVTLVVSYPLDDKFHVVQGGCEGVANCVYAPASDTLVTRYYSGPGLSAKIYRHVSERIHRSFSLTTRITYTFDPTEPEFSFTNSEGHPLLVESLAVSANGKWLALEYRNVGIMRINLETFEMRRVWAQGFSYGFGNDPTIEMAISNDGTALAVMGERSGFSLTTITEGCGDDLRVPIYGVFDSPEKACHVVSLDVAGLISHFHGAYDPRFSDDDSHLYFTVLSQSGEAKSVEVAKSDTFGVSRIQYLALGDSFTSGEGETDRSYYVPGTNEKFETCHQSLRSYPLLFGQLVGFSLTKSVACSGAKIRDIAYFSGEYWGQGGRLGAGSLSLSDASRQQAQLEALNTFQPGRIPQENFVEHYQPEVLTVGIGGNDAGLMTKLKDCLGLGKCEWATAIYRTAEEIQGLFTRLVSLYQRLLHLSPGSRLYAVGYPQLIDPEGECDPLTGALLDGDERHFMKEAVSYLNKVIKAAAHRAGVRYIDEENAFAGHELCSGSSTAAMNGLRTGHDVKISASLPFRLIGNESFHPTPFGHALLAEVVRRSYQDTQSEGEDTVPPIPSYWGIKQPGARSIAEDFVSPTAVAPNDATLTLSLPSNSLEPGSSVKIAVHSEPLVIEGLKANEKGGFYGIISLPKDFEVGFHTVHLFGTSYSGESIELYQAISYEESENPSSSSFMQNDATERLTETIQSFSQSGVLGQMSESQSSSAFENNKPHSSLDSSPLSQLLVIGSICSAISIVIFLLVRKFSAPADG